MSRTIDEKVVTLEFDNADFEKNVKTSMSTLEKFDKSLRLEGAERGIKSVEETVRRFDMSTMDKGLLVVTDGFSKLERVALSVLSSIAIRAEQAGERMIKALSIDNITSGYSKYEQKIDSVQTLVNSTGKSLVEINGYLNTLMRFSDETSYGFSEMAQSLAQLTSSGGDIERLIPMITGIANAVAFAGKGPAEFSRAIYNLNQSYGSGALKYMDWKSLELAGVASKDLKQSFIDTAKELGKISESGKTLKGTIVDIGNFGETLKENWADTEVMEATFAKFSKYTQMADEMVKSGEYLTYADAYKELARNYDDIYIRAAKAAQEAKKFTEVIDATKDAVSSSWLQTFEILFGDYNQAKETWTNLANDLYEIFAVPRADENSILSKAFKSTYEQLGEVFEEVGVSFSDFDTKYRKFLVDAGYSRGLENIIEQYGSLEKALALGNVTIMDSRGNTKWLSDTLKDFTKSFLDSNSAVSETVDSLEKFQDIFDGIWSGSFGNGETRYKKLTKAGYDYTSVQSMINKLAKEGHRAGYKLTADDLAKLSEEELKNIGITSEQAEELRDLAESLGDVNSPLSELLGQLNRKSGQQLLSETISNISKSIINLQDAVKTNWNKVFNINFAEVIYKIVSRIHDFSESIRDATANAKILDPILTTLFSALKVVGKAFSLVYEVVKQLVKGGLDILSRLFSDIDINIEGFGDSISEALDNAIAWLKENQVIFELVSNAADSITKGIKFVNDWLSQFIDFNKVSEYITKYTDSIGKLVSGQYKLSDFTSAFTDFITSIKNGDKDPFKGITDYIASFIASLGSAVVNLKSKAGTSFSDALKKVAPTEEDVEKIRKLFKQVSEYTIGLGSGYIVLTSFGKLADSLSNLISPIKSLSNVFDSFASVGYAIKDYINQLKANILINNMLKIATAVAILAGAIYILSNVGKDEKAIWTAVGATVALIGAMTLLALGVSSLSNSNIGKVEKAAVDFKGLALTIVALGASALILSMALKNIDNLNSKLADIGVLVVTIIALTGAIIALTHFSGKQAIVGAGQMIGLSVAIYAMSVALKKLDGLNIQHPYKVIITFIGIIAAMAVMSHLISGIGWQSGLVLLAIASSIWSLVKILEKIVNEIGTKDYVRGLLRIVPIIGIMAAILVAAKGLNGANSGFTALFITSVGASVFLLAKAIETFGDLSSDKITKGGLVVASLFTVIAYIGAKAAGIAGAANVGIKTGIGTAAVIISAAGSLYIMAGVFMLFKNMSEEELKKGAQTIVACLGGIGLFMIALGRSGLFFGGDLVTKAANSYQVIGALAKMAILIAAIAVSILAVGKLMKPEEIKNAVSALMGVIAMLAILVAAMSLTGGFKDMLINVVQLVAILGAIGGTIYALTQIKNVQQAIKIAEAIGDLALKLSEALFILAAASKLSAGLAGVGSVAAGLGIMMTVIVAISGALAAMEESGILNGHLKGGLDTFVEVLTTVGEALGGFVGAAIGAIGTGISVQLVTIGENLSKFAESLSGLLNINVPPTFKDAITAIGDIIKIFANNLTSIKTLANSSKDMQSFATFCDAYGKGMSALTISMGDANIGKLNAASRVGSAFADLSKSLGSSGGLFSLFTGKKETLASFGENMGKFGDALVNFSTKLGGFRSNIVERSMPTIEKIFGLNNLLDTTGGLWQALTGEKSLETFGNGLSSFGDGLVNLSNSMAKFNPKAADTAIAAGEALSGLEKGLANSPSLLGFITGENQSLGDFGTRIQEFVSGLVNGLNAFNELNSSPAKSVEDFSTPKEFTDSMLQMAIDTATGTTVFDKINETIDGLIKIGEKFSKLENTLAPSSGLFGENSTLGVFGKGIKTFGENLKDFVSSLPSTLPSDADLEKIEKTVETLIDISSLEGIDSASNNLPSLGSAVNSFKDYLGGFVSSVDSLGSSGGGDAASAVASFVGGIFNNEQTIGETTKAAIETSENYLSNIKNVFTSSTILSEANAAITTAANKFVELMDRYKEMKEIGSDYIQGLIDGMNSKKDDLILTADALASSVTKRTRKVLDVESPSKVAYSIGSYFAIGLANGIADMSEDAVDTAESMAMEISDAVKYAMITSNDVLEDVGPIISPILDTSDVIRGSADISRLLNSGAAYNAALAIQASQMGGIQNSGFIQPSINVNFTINEAGGDLTEADFIKFGNEIANIVNEKLGGLV